MGSSSSRLGSTGRFKLSSLICGGSSSRAPLEIEDHPAGVLINSEPVNDGDGNLMSESSSNIHRLGTVLTDSSNDTKSHTGRNSGTASSSLESEQSSDSLSMNISANKEINNSEKRASNVYPENSHPSSSSLSGIINPSYNGASVENRTDEASHVPTTNNLDSASVPRDTSSDLTPIDNSMQEAIPSGLGFRVSNREQNQGDESLLEVDVVSIPSNVFSRTSIDRINHETRRNSRRLFRDAFSGRVSSRHLDSPTIVFSTGDRNPDADDRWVLDFGDDFLDDVIGRDYGFNIGSRLDRLHERRRHSRSMIWESLRNDLDGNSRRTSECPTGLHPEGSCSCESFLTREDSSNHASISRIVMLAETLFEVLDEIHRQPASLLSMVSLPAPESVVDSFLLKNHKKDYALGKDDAAQCHICLAEYENGDKIRVLPCHHEYHMSCVDKWLKEIHGVCPLCRGDVCQGNESQHSAPQHEIHSAS